MCKTVEKTGLQHKKVLVLGDDCRMVLPVVRSLVRCQADVRIGWCPADNPALRSRLARPVPSLPIYVPGQTDWLKALNALQRREQFDIILPVTEGAVYVLQTHRRELEEPGRFYLLDDQAFQTVFSKQKTYALAEQLGIACPRSHLLGIDEDPLPVLRELGLPIVIKPRSSVRDTGELTKHFVRTAHSRQDAIDYLQYLAARGSRTLLQSHFSGYGAGVEILARRGEILLAMQHRRLHETNGYGSTYRESTPLHPGLFEASSKLLGAIQYTGVAMVEFRVKPETDEWVLLEVNGRFWGSLPLAVAAGMDFPKHLAQLWLRDETDFPPGYRTGVRCRSLESDLRWTWRRLRGKGRTFEQENKVCLGWSVNPVSGRQLVVDLVRALTLRDHLDSFCWTDPGPALSELWGMVRNRLLACQSLRGE